MKMKLVCTLCVLILICSSAEGFWRRRRFRIGFRRLFSRRNGGGGGSKKSACPNMCPQNYSPVCGSDGLTYGNMCSFNAAKCKSKKSMKVVYKGRCTKPTTQPTTLPPTTRLPKRPCSWRCPANYKPLCGSDGKTYGNRCQFNAAKCRMKKLSRKTAKKMKIVYQGKCKVISKITATTCTRVCGNKIVPVCATNGVSYQNMCYFKSAKCRLKKNSKLIAVAYRGKCSRWYTKSRSKWYKKKGRKWYKKKERKWYKKGGKKWYKKMRSKWNKKLGKKWYKKLGSKWNKKSGRRWFRTGGSKWYRKKSGGWLGKIGGWFRGSGRGWFRRSRRRWFRKSGRKWYKRSKGRWVAGVWVPGSRCVRRCYMYYSPVCGSNGKTYWNMCVFKAAKCRYNRLRRLRYTYRRRYGWFNVRRGLRYAYRGRCKKTWYVTKWNRRWSRRRWNRRRWNRRRWYRRRWSGRRWYRRRWNGRRWYRRRLYGRRKHRLTVQTIINLLK